MKQEKLAVVIREAYRSDIETLLAFEQGVISTERPFDPTLKEETTYYDFDIMMDDANTRLVVAEAGGQLVGSGYARIEKSKHFRRYPQFAYLGFMYVVPALRGKGINGQILHSLRAWVMEKGITEMRLEVYYENQAAIRAYEKFGFSKISVEMRCEIG
jgi:ribosomal protein S18 acetylase RimI-like enzyme